MGAATLSPSAVQDLCKRYSDENTDVASKIQIVNYMLKMAGEVPAGYLGRHETLYVEIAQGSFETPKEILFFVKSAPVDVASRAKYLEGFGVFKKELYVYKHLLPAIQNGFPHFSARCYYAKNDVLVLEHLGENAFQMAADRSGILDFHHLSCALKTVANMHAASIVFEHRHHKVIPKLHPEAVSENAYPQDPTNVRMVNFNNATTSICELIKSMPEYKDSEYLNDILREFPLRMRVVFELCKPSAKYYNVFNHGDLWANNLLFKYNNKQPVECRLVDFQLTRYAPPILDVITLLTIPTTRAFRVQYLNSLLEDYYVMLKGQLRSHGILAEDLIPREQFYASVKEYRICGLIESCLFSHLTILPDKLTQHLTTDTNGFDKFFGKERQDICSEAFKTDEVYRTRMTDMISDLVDNYILNSKQK